MITAFWVVIILLPAGLDPAGPTKYFIGAAATMIVMPIGLLLGRWLLSRPHPPLVFDRHGIFDGRVYCDWSSLMAVAHVHAGGISHSMWAAGSTLLLFRRVGRVVRMQVPLMSLENELALEDLLQKLSRLHGIDVALDRTSYGRWRLRQLPWF